MKISPKEALVRRERRSEEQWSDDRKALNGDHNERGVVRNPSFSSDEEEEKGEMTDVFNFLFFQKKKMRPLDWGISELTQALWPGPLGTTTDQRQRKFIKCNSF